MSETWKPLVSNQEAARHPPPIRPTPPSQRSRRSRVRRCSRQPAGAVREGPSHLGQGSYLRLIDSCITQLKAQGPSRTCNESSEEEEEGHVLGLRAEEPCTDFRVESLGDLRRSERQPLLQLVQKQPLLQTQAVGRFLLTVRAAPSASHSGEKLPGKGRFLSRQGLQLVRKQPLRLERMRSAPSASHSRENPPLPGKGFLSRQARAARLS